MSGESSESGHSGHPGHPGHSGQEAGKGFAAQVIGNTSLLAAVLFYMGWAYENALLKHFNVAAFSLGISTVEYVLKGLVPVFQSVIVFIAVIVVVVLTLTHRAASANRAEPANRAEWAKRFVLRPVRTAIVGLAWCDRMMLAGLLLVAVALPLAWIAVSVDGGDTWLARNAGVFYVVLALLGTGTMLTAWPLRRSGPGPFSYPLAIVVAVMCTLWVAGQYAGNLGTSAAGTIADTLPVQTAVTLYSIQSLALSGPGVHCAPLGFPAEYRYRCTGLRLLYVQSGTYYLLPVRWSAQPDPTYVIDDSDQVRFELSGG